MIGAIRRIPLGTRYAYGFAFVFITGLVMGFGAQASSRDTKMLWAMITAIAIIHWLSSVTYWWWERRWYRYAVFIFSILASTSYVDLTMRVWGK